jgi:hypothetical protein
VTPIGPSMSFFTVRATPVLPSPTLSANEGEIVG